MTNKELADLIFPNITKTIEDFEVASIVNNMFLARAIQE